MPSEEHAAPPGSPLAPQPSPAIPDHELLCLIGRGAYGEVWLARNAIGTLRAVKIVHRQSFGRAEHFEREFKGLLKFEPVSRSHEGLVHVLQIGRRDDAGYFFYVMELADDCVAADVRRLTSNAEPRTPHSGLDQNPLTSAATYSPKTLRSELQARGSLPPAECVALGLKLAAALEHLHANGLVHRDIKPSNIIFVNGEPKLADIGLVTAIDEAQSLVGTAGYIPPEGPGTPQADLYSLGKVLYEIAFGKDRQEFPQLPPDLQSHPEYTALLELNEIIIKACESDPRLRYPNATALGEDLALLQRGQSVKRQRLGQRRWAFARKLGFAAVAMALLATAVTVLKGSKHDHIPAPEAKHLYELGQWHYNQLTSEHHAEAFKCLSEAIRIDPQFVPPYGELTALYAWTMMPGITNDQERLQKMRAIANQVMAINPNAAEGHVALSLCHFLKRDWRGAEAEIVLAIKLNPKHAFAHALYCFYLSMLGRTAEAHHEGELAEELDPPEAARVTAIAATWPFMAERRYDKAIAQLQQVMELDRNFPTGHQYLGDCYQAESNYLAAIEEYRTTDLLSGEDPVKVAASYDALRRAYDTHGEQGYFREWLELVRADESLPEEKQLFYDTSLAGCYARLGESEKALDELEKHFDEPNFWQRLMFDPLYDSLHNEPRFKALVRRAGLEK